MPPLTLLIKPASGNCNLRCRYCFYEDISCKRAQSSFGMMTDETLRYLVEKAFSEAEGGVTFAFQGGEPTLVGLPFYKKLIFYIDTYNTQKLPVQKTIQTNGVLIDEEWASFLAEQRFLVGLSLDGPRELHDLNRVTPSGKGSFDQVMRAVSLFEKYKVEYNILCVVTKRVASHIKEVYRFFGKQGFCYLQFIPCLDPLGESRGKHPYSLTHADYTVFLKTLFDRWYEDIAKGSYVSIRQFENYVQMLRGNPPESCGMSGRCACYFVVEADGSVYPCDFYVLDEWQLGSIFEGSFAALQSSETAQRFIGGSACLDPKCRACKWYPLCRGGCRRDREAERNYFCQSYMDFFEYALPRLQELARYL